MQANVAQKARSASCGHSVPCGCEYADCCFDCPLPDCRFVRQEDKTDEVGVVGLSNAERVRCMLIAGLSKEDIANRLRIKEAAVGQLSKVVEE